MKLFEIFQDTDGGTSAKRFAFFIFIILYCAVAMGVVFHGVTADVVNFSNGLLDKTADIIKWLGAYILGDKAPAMLAALKGPSSQNRTTSIVTTEKVEPPVTGG